MTVSLRDVAAKAGVSPGAVSHVLNGNTKARIGRETQARVRRIAAELGYRPNHAARSLATGRSEVIALWMSNIYSSYFARAVHISQAQAALRGYEMLVRHVTSDIYSQSDSKWLSQWPVDGVLAFEWPEHVDAFLDAVPEAARPPIVSMGAYYSKRVDHVAVDYYGGAREATEHLLASDCRRVAYFVSDWGCHPGDARYDGYTEAMRTAGREPEYVTVEHAQRTLARETLRELMAAPSRPDGLFCFNDDLALAAYRALRDLGLRVPDDVALVGCDGIEDTEYVDPALSTIVAPQEEMCSAAWEFLLQRLATPLAPPQRLVLPSRLVIRASSQRH